MVKFKKGIKGITPFAIGAFALYGCTKEGEEVEPKLEVQPMEAKPLVLNTNDMLIGDWKIISVDGEPFGQEYNGYTYSSGFKFELEGDFGYCYESFNETDSTKNESYCMITGEWEWLDDLQTELKLTQDIYSEDYIIYLTIENLTEDLMEGDVYIEDEPGVVYEVVFEKYAFEK